MFKIGDKVTVNDGFEGSVVLAGWRESEIDGYTFEVTTFENYEKTNPKFAEVIKNKPSAKGEIFLKYEKVVFVLSPTSCLSLVEKGTATCQCPIRDLWAGAGHSLRCPEA